MASSRCRRCARLGFVAMRRRGATLACRTSSARRSRASARLRSCVRKRSARMTSTPSSVRRRPASRASRAHRPGQRGRAAHVEAQLDRGRDLVDVLPAGAGGAHEAFLDLPLVEHDLVGDAHGTSSVATVEIPVVAAKIEQRLGIGAEHPATTRPMKIECVVNWWRSMSSQSRLASAPARTGAPVSSVSQSRPAKRASPRTPRRPAKRSATSSCSRDRRLTLKQRALAIRSWAPDRRCTQTRIVGGLSEASTPLSP